LALVQDARERRSAHPDLRSAVAKALPAVAFVAAAAWFAAASSSTRHVDARGLILVVLFAVLSRVEFEVGSGSAVPTQLAFVLMLFVLPLPLVPFAVAVAYVLGAGVDALAHGRSPWRAIGTIGCSWFSFPAALVLWWAGEPGPEWRHWPVFAAAVAAQIAGDSLHTLVHERVAHGLRYPALWRPLAFTYVLDVLLTPMGIVAARSGGYSFLAVLPLCAVFEMVARERRIRLDALAEAARQEQLARTDSLTGLPNRREFDETLAGALDRSSTNGVAVCLLDLDHFKSYNDRFGHLAGDELLREAAAVWRLLLPSDVLVARLGGEEFALLFQSDDLPAIEALVERARASTPTVTCSAGLAHRYEEVRPAELVNRADAALYDAKAAGRDCLRVERRSVTRRGAVAV
jgi:diguanylate cyclase (GGDEF)-like protein